MFPIFRREEYRRQLRSNPFGLPRMFFKDLKYSRQRIQKGYCDIDMWNIFDWFLLVMPDMLEELKRTHHGSPACLIDEDKKDHITGCDDGCHAKWEEILSEMIFLMREAQDDTCSKKNPYKEESKRIYEEFEKKYGMFGEKLLSEQEKKSNYKRIYLPSDLPEYKEAEDRYFEESRKIEAYQDECKNKALTMFSEWFWDLWD